MLEAALSASKYVHFETPEKADAVINFLKNHGFSQTQISNLVRRCPNLLKCKPFCPKWNSFPLKGFQVLALQNFLLGSLIFLGEALRNKSPLLLIGMPESIIISIFQKQRRTFRVNPVQFREAVEEVKEMGFNPSTMKFAKAVHAVRSMSKSTWEMKFNVYKKWGWTEDEVSLAFRSHPWCMTVSEEKLMRVMVFLVNKMGMESSLIKKCSVLVSLSLEKRLILGGLFLQVLFSKGLVKKNFKMHTYFLCPEKTFLQKFVMIHEEEASELLKLYKESLDSSK